MSKNEPAKSRFSGAEGAWEIWGEVENLGVLIKGKIHKSWSWESEKKQVDF